jgi:amino acid transporter
MRKSLIKKLQAGVLVFSLVLVLAGALAPSVLAQRADIGFNYARDIGLAEAAEEDVRDTAVEIVKYLLTFLALIAVIIVLYGGFVWMTAAGNEDRVKKAKNIIVAGIIGLAIILAAFAIVQFVVDIAYKAIDSDF